MRPHLIFASLLAAFGAGVGAFIDVSAAHADPLPTLPYAARVHGYAAWSPWVRGDIRSIGMSNATVGLGDSISSVSENPAGLAMTLPTFSVQFNRNTIPDGNTQSYDQPNQVSNFGAVINPYPWAFSIGYESPHSERQTSLLHDGSTVATSDLSVKDFTVSASRVLLNDRLSVGIEAAFSTAERSLDFNGQDYNAGALALKMTVGALYQLDHRILLGLRWTPATTYGTPGDLTNPPVLPGYLTQPTFSPWILGLGVGWIPNTNFRAGVSALLVGRTPYAALVADQDRIVGEKITLQPRVGIDYRWIDLRWLEGRFTAGSYFEMSRIADSPSRLHGTVGLELNPYIFNLGVASDRAVGYKNFTAGMGLDLVRLGRVLDLIPNDTSRSYGGFFSSPTQLDSAYLPRPLNPDWDPTQTATPGKILDIAKQIPERISDKINGKPTEPFKEGEHTNADQAKAVENPSAKPSRPKKTKNSAKQKPKPAAPGNSLPDTRHP